MNRFKFIISFHKQIPPKVLQLCIPHIQYTVNNASIKSPGLEWVYLSPLVFVLVAQRFAQYPPEKVVPLPFLSCVALVWFERHTFSNRAATFRPYRVCLSLQDMCSNTHRGNTERAISIGLREQSVLFVSGKKKKKSLDLKKIEIERK